VLGIMESTLVILKPDALKRGLIGEIIKRIEQKGFVINTMKMEVLDKKLLEVHYKHLRDYPKYQDVIDFMSRGPSIVMIICGPGAVRGLRSLRGSTYDSHPGTIRGDFSNHSLYWENLIHCSENITEAEIEIKRFFYCILT
jgi:nucleoside-diphosphate kinase